MNKKIILSLVAIAAIIPVLGIGMIPDNVAQTIPGEEDTHQETVIANDAINNFVISGLVESYYGGAWPHVSVNDLAKLKTMNDNSLGMRGFDDLLTSDVAEFS